MNIHPTAIVAEGAVLGEGCSVGPYSVIGPKVVLGKGNKVLSHVVLDGNTKLGDDNIIFQFSSVGAIPQDLKYRGEESRLEIGDRNIIREYATLQPGTEGGGMVTVIGDRNLFMACSHVGHDCRVGNGNVFANGAVLAGHVTVGNTVTLGGLSGIHQSVRLGDYSFLAGGAIVVHDVPPFCYAIGNRAYLAGVNKIGLERAGFERDVIRDLFGVYQKVFFGEGTLRDRVFLLLNEYTEVGPPRILLEFIQTSSRGILLPPRTEL